MATDLEQKTRPAVPKHEHFVEEQIARVRGRVRAQDAGKAFLIFLIFTLTYALGMALVDRAAELSPLVRLSAFAVFALVSAGLLAWTLLCLVRRVNPYYAAKQLEQTLPDAKNSLVNWLDLRDQNLPPVIHNALGLRAARDVKKADPDEVISAGPTWILGGVLTALIIAVLVLFVTGPQQFMSLLERAFTPFREADIVGKTFIEIVEPEKGNASVPPGRAIVFRAKVDGHVPAINQPGAPRLLWRYNQSEPFVSQPLEKDAEELWAWTMPADQVVNGGLWYKITAGDKETEEYQITVSAIPQVRGFQVAYHFRPYLGLQEKTADYPPGFAGLKAPRGTAITLRVRANCDVSQGRLELNWTGDKTPQSMPAEIAVNDPTSMRFPKIVLDRPGYFRVTFVSREGKHNIDRADYPIEVFQDKKPHVELLKPGKDIELPANGTLQLEGVASDDHGVKGIRLQVQEMKPAGVHPLEPKQYRPGKSFKLVDGKYPDFLEYKDFVPLEKLKNAKREAFPLSKGMVLEYWLEAVDNSDYPEPAGNLGKSKSYKITITDPEKDQKKQQQDRQEVEKEQKQHEQKQDRNMDKQNEKASKEPKSGKQENQRDKKLEKQLKDQAEKAADEIEKKLKPNKQEPNKQEPNKQKPNKQKPNKQKPGEGDKSTEPKNDPNKSPPEKEQKEQSKPGDKQSADQPQAQPKGGKSEANAPKPEAKDNKKSPMDNPGDAKNGGQEKKENKAGQSKDDGNNKGKDEKKGDKAGQAKDAGKKDSQSGNPGTGKPEAGAGKEKPGQADTKPGAPKQQPQPGKTKENGGGSEERVTEAKKGPVDSKQKSPGLAKGHEEQGEGTKPGKRPDSGKQPQANNNNQQKGSPGKEKANNSAKKDPTPDDIARLAKDLKSGDPKAQEAAEKELSRICRECQNPGARGAAGEALRQANKTPPMQQTGEEPPGNGNNTANQNQAESHGPGGKPGKENPNEKGKGNGEGEPGAQLGPKKGGNQAGGSGDGTGGVKDDGKAKPANDAFNKLGANLQLEHWKKLLKSSPEELKKAGITDEQWKNFSKAVADYEKLLRQLDAKSAKNGNLVGGTSKLNSTGPTKLDSISSRPLDPLDYSRAEPPPEFREAQQRFTATPPNKKK